MTVTLGMLVAFLIIWAAVGIFGAISFNVFFDRHQHHHESVNYLIFALWPLALPLIVVGCGLYGLWPRSR